MSADNWRICPRCKKKAEADYAEEVRRVGEAYGKVPPEEYLRMTRDLQKPPALNETLREDYELGTDKDGEFYVSYSASCSVCKFSHRFKHSEQLNV